jgi:hypothetical protein
VHQESYPRTSSIEFVRVVPKGAPLTIAVFSLCLKSLSSELSKIPFECRLGSSRFILDMIPLIMQSLATVSASSTVSDERYDLTSELDTAGCFCSSSFCGSVFFSPCLTLFSNSASMLIAALPTAPASKLQNRPVGSTRHIPILPLWSLLPIARSAL